MKSNPYVYPSLDFADLSQSQTRWSVKEGDTLSFGELLELIEKHFPNSLDKFKAAGTTREEQLLELFVSDEVCFGEKELVLEVKEPWLELFRKSIAAGALDLTIFGFPFKMPVAIKTNRFLPDGGELMVLVNLLRLIRKVEEISGVKAKLTIFAEEGFAKFVGVDEQDAEKYVQVLEGWLRDKFFEGEIEVVRISNQENLPEFSAIFEEEFAKNKEQLAKGDVEFMKRYNGTKDIFFRIVNPGTENLAVLAEVYGKEDDEEISEDALAVRQRILAQIPDTVCQYFAYLKTRDRLNFLEKTVENPITLSVSPKKGRLGIFPVRKEVMVLPYHGAPVISEKNGVNICYIFDLMRTGRTFTALYWENDPDRSPFLYLE